MRCIPSSFREGLSGGRRALWKPQERPPALAWLPRNLYQWTKVQGSCALRADPLIHSKIPSE